MVRGLPVPSGVHIDAARRSSAVQRLRVGGATASSGQPIGRAAATGENGMKLCGHDIGIEHPIFLIAGPDTLESQQLALDVAGHIAPLAKKLGILYVFKGSFDKANRSSHKS